MKEPVSVADATDLSRLIPAHTSNLDDVLAEAFRLFARGVADRRSAFRTPAIATVGPDNTPHVRTMVLRQFDPTTRRLLLHTDLRADKLTDIANVPRAAVHVYDARAALQVRLSAQVQVHTGDPVAQAAWANGAPASHVCYAIEPPPGTEVQAPPPAATDQNAGFTNFAVLALTFNTLEWLWLYHGGHRRARYVWTADAPPRATWLVP
ncbi:MAG: hypothetical protein B7Z77_00145 [Acidocella sp. 20-58-15]|nr:MAG: hypothetical protein B7Z77_00145 [Acidocella sp. 20-58-15]